MYCKKCGTEQKDGHKFCPKCGTPFSDMEQLEANNSHKVSLTEDKVEEMNAPAEKEQTQEQRNENENNGTRLLTPNEKKKVVRIAKGGMWIIVIAIVFTFVRAGFGFSFWWYIYLILFALVAFTLFGITLSDSEGKAKEFDSNDASVVNIISWMGAAMLVILYLWGPLNHDYRSSVEEKGSYGYEESSGSSNDSDRAPSWIQGTWTCVTPYGNMQVEIVGDHIREIPGDGTSYYGTYHIQGDDIMTESGSGMYYHMDKSSKRLEAGQGYYFEKQ